MFKSKFKDVIKGNEDFEVIKDVDALDVQGGAHCVALNSCGTFNGSCDILANCTSFNADSGSCNMPF